MTARLAQVLLILSLCWLSWLSMMLVHECGHILAARLSGGTVRKLVWYPAALSRTDVSPNPHPAIETWAGPMYGSIAPLALAIAVSATGARIAYLFWFFAGFCLLANGAYIGVGSFWPVGDAKVLLINGASRSSLGVFGLAAVMSGLLILDRVSPWLGFGTSPKFVRKKDVLLTVLAAAVVTAISYFTGAGDT
jgi:hypothetical protein